MRRLGVIAGLCAAAALLPLGASAAGSRPLQLTEAAGAKFPVRAFVIGLPDARRLTADDVSVSENGQSVIDLTLVPASKAAKQTFGVVLVIDASDSMAGTPIARAVAAAQAFVARRNPNQQVGIVAFNNTPHVVLPLTSSSAKIGAALAAAPTVAYGTHIYDAVAAAEAMLRHGHIGVGSIVLLSDGADTGSKVSAARIARVARTQHLRVFTVGLRSPSFQAHTLESLAAVGNGQYALAHRTADLGPLFDQLGQLLSQEYLVQYKSLAAPDVPVKVSVAVSGLGRAASAYRTPALPVSVPPPYKPSLTSRILGSWIALVLLSLLVAGVVAFIVIAILQPQRSQLPLRMAEFVSVPGLQSRERRHGALTEDEEAEKIRRGGPLARLANVLDIARINTTAPRLVAGTIAATVVLFTLLLAGTGSAWWALLALLVPMGVRWWVNWKLERRRKAFAEQLPDMLQIVSAALRAGQSFAGSLAVVVESAGEPMRSEMQTVVADEQLGVPLDKAMAVVVRRMASRDLEQISLVAELQREAGGNAAEVIDRVAETVRDRFELRRLINTLTIQGRMSRWIVTALPVALVVLVSLNNPHYLTPLTSHELGKVAIVFAVLLVIGGSLVIKKIVDIKV